MNAGIMHRQHQQLDSPVPVWVSYTAVHQYTFGATPGILPVVPGPSLFLCLFPGYWLRYASKASGPQVSTTCCQKAGQHFVCSLVDACCQVRVSIVKAEHTTCSPIPDLLVGTQGRACTTAGRGDRACVLETDPP